MLKFNCASGQTASQWTTANPTLAQGETGIEMDTGKFKFGDGATAWISLAYANTGGSVGPVQATGNATISVDSANLQYNAAGNTETDFVNYTTTGNAAPFDWYGVNANVGPHTLAEAVTAGPIMRLAGTEDAETELILTNLFQNLASADMSQLILFASSQHGNYGLHKTVGIAAALDNSFSTDLKAYYATSSTDPVESNNGNMVIGWTPNFAYHLATVDTAMSRDSAGVIDFGNGGFKDKSATLQAGVMNLQAAQSTETGATSGSMICSQPFRGASYKKVVINLAALVGTASYTFPVSFSAAPGVFLDTAATASGATVSVNTTAVTVTGATSSGVIVLEGY